ncbi:hypothetical protein C8Q78DRAFT_1081853 [Trametes maxima]|nr:hypothetical protein C8Q78DRAFT_1081853 [Trametes maxima]
MYFQGEPGSEDIKIEVPVEYFLYAAHPSRSLYEGLVFPRRSRSQWVLGLNWFHVNFVAMHKPQTGLPYVRLAPQGYEQTKLQEFMLPPVADEAST